MAITAQMRSDVSALYAALFGRAPEKAGLDYWTGELDKGVSLASVAQTMYNTEPARAYYPTGVSNADLVKAFYLNVLGRAGDAEGLAFWEGRLVTLGNAGALIAEMVQNVQSYTGTDPAGLTSKALFDNKVAVGVTYGYTLGKEDVTLAKTVLALVTATDKTAAEIAANVGQTFTLTTGTDSLIGTSGNDTFNGAATAYANTDRVIDTSTTDHDTYNVTIAAAATIDATNIENVNVTTAATSALTVTASSLSGVKTLTVTPGDVSVGGSTITGSKTVTIDRLSSAKVEKVVVGAGVTGAVSIDMTAATAAESKAGVAITADTATGNITVTGATTLNAANAADTTGEKIVVQAINGAAAAENGKAVTINAAKALDVEVLDNTSKFTGAITVNAALATEVAVNNAVGGVTITAAKAADSAGNGIVVANIDDSGATITTGSYGSISAGVISKQGKIDLGGTAATSDAATVAAAGYVGLTTNTGNQIETVNLSGNGAAVTYAITGAATTYNLTGTQDVTLTGNESSFDGKTVTDSTTAGTTTVKITTLDDSDLSKVAADKIVVASNVASKTLTVATGANLELASDIGTAFTVAGKNTGSTVNISTGDDTNASGATISIDTGTFTASTNITAVNLSALTGKFSATSTVLDGNATTGATLTVTGSKDVALGTVTAKTVSAADFTGKLSLTAAGATTAKSITSGTGADTIVLNEGTLKFTLDAGAGDNTVTVTAVAEATSIATGAGADTINLNDADAVVVVTGAGDDTVNYGIAGDAIVVMGDGTGDKLVFGGAYDLSAKSNYAVTGVETVDVTAANGTVKVKASSFANDNAFKLVGNSATADIFHVVNTGTAGAVIDASGVTFSATQDAALVLEGAAKLADTITGSAKNDTIVATSGADIVNGGDGTDTFNAANLGGGVADVEGTGTGTAAGVVINLGSTAVTNTAILSGAGGFTANSVTSVEGGKTAYLFSAAASANSAVQQTLSSIENVVGTAGRDYIVGSANDNVITGGVGADYINVGVGTDTVAITAASQTGAGITADGTLTSVDVVVGMSAGDKIDLSGLAQATLQSLGATAEGATYIANATTGGAVLTQGTYTSSTGAFAAGAGGTDLLFVFDTNGVAAGGLEAIVLIGSNAGIASFSSDATGVFTFA